jgi:3-oxoacyl-(acyl-carrier-protein) synthase
MFAGWTNLRVLARHPDPTKASRPFDRNRTGIVLGEGGAMVVLESRESALARGATPLARLTGCGTSSDAVSPTTPDPIGQAEAIRRCLRSAGLTPADVDYINAHGTGTKLNDATEAEAIRAVFGPAGPRTPVSSIKSMLGHCMGAAGAIELVACVFAVRKNYVPPTINCDDPDPDLGLDYVPNQGRRHEVRRAMSNSFGFGGSNCCLVVERFDS